MAALDELFKLGIFDEETKRLLEENPDLAQRGLESLGKSSEELQQSSVDARLNDEIINALAQAGGDEVTPELKEFTESLPNVRQRQANVAEQRKSPGAAAQIRFKQRELAENAALAEAQHAGFESIDEARVFAEAPPQAEELIDPARAVAEAAKVQEVALDPNTISEISMEIDAPVAGGPEPVDPQALIAEAQSIPGAEAIATAVDVPIPPPEVEPEIDIDLGGIFGAGGGGGGGSFLGFLGL